MNEYTKSFYKISEVADFVDESSTTLRYWEKEFPDTIKPVRHTGKIRYYTPEVIEKVKLIKYLLRERGMRIEAVKQELRVNGKNVSKRMQILATLEDVRSELLQLRAALMKRR